MPRARTSSAGQTVSQMPPPAKYDEPSRKKILLISLAAVGAFVVVIVLIVMLVLKLTSGIAGVANDQLKDFKSGDLKAAYGLTAQEFQKTVSPEAFAQFVSQYSFLQKNKGYKITEREVVNDEGKIKAILTTEDGQEIAVDFKLVKEDGNWKVLSINLKAAGNATSQIFDVRLNEKVDERGVVQENKDTFSTAAENIHLSAYVEGAVAGDKISVAIVYLKTGEVLGPVVNTVEEGGDVISNFYFSKPDAGWIAGEYKATVTTSGGSNKEVTFTIK